MGRPAGRLLPAPTESGEKAPPAPDAPQNPQPPPSIPSLTEQEVGARYPLDRTNTPWNFKYPEKHPNKRITGNKYRRVCPRSVSPCSFKGVAPVPKGVAPLKRRHLTAYQQGTRRTVPLVTMSYTPPSDPKRQNHRPQRWEHTHQ